MSYVGDPPFTHDLFVTFSHGAQGGDGIGYLQPWSAAFASALEHEFRADAKFRSSFKVFLDNDHRPGRGLDPLAKFDQQLQASVSGCALLVVLMSNDYLNSSWCKQELEWFTTSRQGAGAAGDNESAVVRAWPTNEEEWPPELRGRLGFKFHDRAAASKPLGWIEIQAGQHLGIEFRKALADLVNHIYTRLDDIKIKREARQRAQTEAQRLGGGSGESLYLYGRAEQKESWGNTASELVDAGFAVFGEPETPVPDPKALQQARNRRVDILGECDALLLLAADASPAIEQDLIVVGKHDRNSARARVNRVLPCAVLDRTGVAAPPIRKASARNLEVDWLDTMVQPWTGAVRTWLQTKGRLIEAGR
jgi:hypothetical protein